ncbi:hypothetical protein [Nonomuraea cavernae]|uniref:hypothetical protein n=1 Tax=Nonomuraea cavernae TaxID=2045107 RepID=UPI0034083726
MESVVSALPGDLRDSGERISGYEALSMRLDHEYSIGVVGEWTVVSDPGMQLVYDRKLGELLSVQRRALAFLVHSVSSVYGFALYRDGHLSRRALYLEGEVQDEMGDRLPEEENLPHSATEDHVLDLIPRLTGIRWPEVLQAPFRVLQPL